MNIRSWKRLIILLMFFGLQMSVVGAEYPLSLSTCLKYIHVVEQGKPLTDPLPWELAGRDHSVWITAWRADYPAPTPEYCVEIEQSAIAWKSASEIEHESTDRNWSKRERAIVRALVICINKRLPVGNKITAAELKAEIKEQLQ
jgi:hypothetical protein